MTTPQSFSYGTSDLPLHLLKSWRAIKGKVFFVSLFLFPFALYIRGYFSIIKTGSVCGEFDIVCLDVCAVVIQ